MVRFSQPSDKVLREFKSSLYDVAAYKPDGFLDIVTTIPQANEWKKQHDINIIQESKKLGQRLANRSRQHDDSYRDYDRMLSELQDIEAAYPAIAKLVDIGDSWGKQYSDAGNGYYDNSIHDIWALKISDRVTASEDEPAIFYMGTHHAREPISMEVTIAIIHHILNYYGSDPQITANVNQTEIWFIPLLNPDGHRIVIDKEDVLWRKNIRDNNANGRLDTKGESGNEPDGVDLNRNYGFQWGSTGSSDSPYSSIYHGPEAMSEPEVRSIRDLFESHHFVAGISYHSYGEFVLYPYGYDSSALAPDTMALAQISDAMASTIPRLEHRKEHYTSQAAWDYYPVMGALMDFSYGDYGIFCYTIELGVEFIPPVPQIAHIADDNINAALLLLNRLHHTVLTGRITEGISDEPVDAEIIVNGIDDLMMNLDDRFPNQYAYRSPYRSSLQFGRYYRLLPEGTYDVSFSADGYQTVSASSVIISRSHKTILDISLERSGCPVIETTARDLYAGVAGGSLFIFLKGEDVAEWTIAYNGFSTTASKHKKVLRINGISRDIRDVSVTAHGYDSDGAPCSDVEMFHIDPEAPACPVNEIDNSMPLNVTRGGSISLPLEGSHVDTWEVTYNGYTATLPGKQDSYRLKDLKEDTAFVTISAKGYDSDGSICEDRLSVELDFSQGAADAEPAVIDTGGCFVSAFMHQ